MWSGRIKIINKMKSLARLKFINRKQCGNYLQNTLSTQQILKNGLFLLPNLQFEKLK